MGNLRQFAGQLNVTGQRALRTVVVLRRICLMRFDIYAQRGALGAGSRQSINDAATTAKVHSQSLSFLRLPSTGSS